MSKEIHEDQPLVEPGAAWIKQFWAPAIHANANYTGTQSPAYIGVGESAAIVHKLPTDLVALDQALLAVRATLTQAYNITITGRAGACGENILTHLQADTRNYNWIQNILACIDLVTILPAFFAVLEAEDHVWFTVRNNTAQDVAVFGLDARYS